MNTPTPFAALAGQRLTSAWHLLDQDRVDAFAALTEDHQFIHVDPQRAAAETPFGGTIAHGYLTLSMLAVMAAQALPRFEGLRSSLNYGFDKVRFLAPVRVGKSVRGHFALAEALTGEHGAWRVRWTVEVEIEGEVKPALVAEWWTLLFFHAAGS